MGHRDTESAGNTRTVSASPALVFIRRRFSIGIFAVVIFVLFWVIGIALDALFHTRFFLFRSVFYRLTRCLALILIPATFIYGFIRRYALETKRWDFWGLVLAILAVFLVPWSRPTYLEAASILKDGRLAPLPKSATEVKAHSWAGLFTGSSYLTFRATPDVIEAFVTNSPSIKGAKPEWFNAKHMYLPYPGRNTTSASSVDYSNEQNSEHEYFFRYPGAPSWFNPTIRARGRKYNIPPDPNMRGHNDGHLIIDDDKGIVYVWVMWS